MPGVLYEKRKFGCRLTQEGDGGRPGERELFTSHGERPPKKPALPTPDLRPPASRTVRE